MKFNFLYACYRLLSQSFAIPLANILLKYRLKKGKEDPSRLHERRGEPRQNFQEVAKISNSKMLENLIWIHAASVGESVSVLTFVDHLLKYDPSCVIMVTTGTLASGIVMDQKLPDRAFHQFIPLDLQPWVQQFLGLWQPKIAFWVESEIWPNLIHEVGHRKIPLVMINGRMSQKSFDHWQWAKGFIDHLLQQFSLCFVQSSEDAKRLKALGAQNIIDVENLKFAAQPLSYDPQLLKELQVKIGQRPLWVAASTHEAEEDSLMACHHLLKKKFPDLLTIIVPRHPNRGSSIKQRWQSEIYIAQRSHQDSIDQNTQIYLADTMGELGLFYALASVVFVGGSLAPIGGHNLIEPAHFKCALLHGPYMFKCQDVRDLFHRSKAAVQINSAQELADRLEHFFTSPNECLEMAQRAQQVVQIHQQIIDKMMIKLDPLLKQNV
ncbi:MAG: 3-deoxy-D-manno-octulosonic acid transferase [Janthinobacterium lividum]